MLQKLHFLHIELILSLLSIALVAIILYAAIPTNNPENQLDRYYRDLSLREVSPPKGDLVSHKEICSQLNPATPSYLCGNLPAALVNKISAEQLEQWQEKIDQQFNDGMHSYRNGRMSLQKNLAYWETVEYKSRTNSSDQNAFKKYLNKARALIDSAKRRELDFQALSEYASKQIANREAVLNSYDEYFSAEKITPKYESAKHAFLSSLRHQDVKSAYANLYQMAKISTGFNSKLNDSPTTAERASQMLSLLQWQWQLFIPFVLLVLLASRFLVQKAPPHLFAGMILFAGLGWAILIDLSIHFIEKHRLLALNQEKTLIIGFVLFFFIVLLLPYLRKWVLEPWLHGGSGVLGKVPPIVIFVALIIGAIVTKSRIGVSAEIVKILLLFTLAWVFSERTTPLILKNIFMKGSINWRLLTKFMAWTAVVITILFGLLYWFEDMGPFMLLGLILSLAFFLLFGWRGFSLYVALATLSGWLLALSSSRISQRIAEYLAPFTEGTGQLARLHWFSEYSSEAGWFGFGFGKIPWFGSRTTGVPEQIQSDYTYTALVGAIGHAGTVAIVLTYLIWLWGSLFYLMQRLRQPEQQRADYFLAWFGFFGVLTLLLQAVITIFGNLRVVPLTGITWPLISYGATSFYLTMAICAFVYALTRTSRVF